MRSLIPAAAHLVIQHGSHILLLQRSLRCDMWPGFWAFPGGKVENHEFFREAAIRESQEEIGILIQEKGILEETIIMYRTIQGTKVGYFGLVEAYENTPDIREPHLASDLAWFALDELPGLIVPHHREALDALLTHQSYKEFDMTNI